MIFRFTHFKGEMEMGNKKLKEMIVAAMFAAIIAVAAQIMINIPPVPFTLLTIAVMLTATILPTKYTLLAIVLYLAMGMVGAPVFGGMKGGLAVLTGPTGGYLVGLLPVAVFISSYIAFVKHNKWHVVIANCMGAMLILAIGVIWLKIVTGLTWQAAFESGLLLFIVPDLIKAVIAAFVGLRIRARLKSAKLI